MGTRTRVESRPRACDAARYQPACVRRSVSSYCPRSTSFVIESSRNPDGAA